jgi:hypothetical protein
VGSDESVSQIVYEKNDVNKINDLKSSKRTFLSNTLEIVNINKDKNKKLAGFEDLNEVGQ